MVEEPERIRDDIEVTRAELARNVDRLADRTNPARMAQRRWEGVKGKVRGVSERVMGAPTNAVSSTRESAGAAADRARELATETGDRARAAAADVAGTVRQAPGRVARQTQGSPVAAGLIAFGVGLLAASLMPATDAERRAGQELRDRAPDLLEPVREPLAESAQQLREDLGGSVRDAADEVRGTAKEAVVETKDQARGR